MEAALPWHPESRVGWPGLFLSSEHSVCDQEVELNQALLSTYTSAL